MKEKKTDKSFLGYVTRFMDRFSGDKVIFLIALFLMLISVVSVFSSTPRLVKEDKGIDRVSIMVDQLKVVALGFALIFAIYFLGRQSLYKGISKWCFGISFVILAFLVANVNLGPVRAADVNGARRIIMVAGHQIHVYEYVKLMMILYLSWALDTYKNDGFKWAPRLAQKYGRLKFLEKNFWQKVVYIYLPIGLITALVMTGSNSSALFIGAIMVLMVLVGGLNFKDILLLGATAAIAVGCLVGASELGLINGKQFRFDTLKSRITNDDSAYMKILLESERDSKAWQDARDKLDQPTGALLAIKEGGIFGKGIGNSTQKYQVPVIFGDYMFSFIVEETGILGALVLIILYFSLLARGSMVAKMCEDYYDKIIVTGLIILVTGQAFMHMCVNVHMPLVPQTGQTLPLVSHGANAFLVFSAVFGILLGISKDAKENMERRAEELRQQNIWTQDSTI